jgi:hypothetical protein
MSVLHGVGRALKEEKLVDHRPAASADITNPNRGTAALSK